jgi:hypothetical protein
MPAPYRTKSGAGGASPDVLSLTLSARLAGDPNLLLIYGAVGVLLAFANLRYIFTK